MKFLDRRQAGQQLAAELLAYRHRPEVMVLALPRGGVPVGQEVATALGAPLDVFVVRKLGVPYHPEYAFGAIASGGVTVINPEAERLQLDAHDSAIFFDAWSHFFLAIAFALGVGHNLGLLGKTAKTSHERHDTFIWFSFHKKPPFLPAVRRAIIFYHQAHGCADVELPDLRVHRG